MLKFYIPVVHWSLVRHSCRYITINHTPGFICIAPLFPLIALGWPCVQFWSPMAFCCFSTSCLVCDSYSVFPCFWWPRWLWGISIRYSVWWFSALICLTFSSWLGWDYRIWKRIAQRGSFLIIPSYQGVHDINTTYPWLC